MKKVLIVPDIPGWVMESIANGIVSGLKDKFDFTILYGDNVSKDHGKELVKWNKIKRFDVVYVMLSGYLPNNLDSYSNIVTSFHGGPGSESQANRLQRMGLANMPMSYVSDQTRKRLEEWKFESSEKVAVKIERKMDLDSVRKNLSLKESDEMALHSLGIPINKLTADEYAQVKVKFSKTGFGLTNLFWTPYGIDMNIYNQHEVINKFSCGYAGWARYLLGNQKDHRRGHWILNAWKELQFKLQIAGGLRNLGGGMKSVKQLKDKYGNTNMEVSLYNRDNMKDFYRKISCYLVPDKYAGGPMPVLEAGAMGIPVITTDCGHCGDFIEHDVHGKVIKTYKEFTEAIRWMKDHPQKRRQMGLNLKKYIEENRTWKAVSNYWENFFNAV